MTMQRKRSAAIAAILTVVAWMALPARANAATPAQVHIREASVLADGTTQVIVSVAGAGATFTRDAFTVAQDGKRVEGFTVTPLDAGTVPVAVALVFDVSGSTVGTPLADAKAAGTRFVNSVPKGVRVALVAFSDRAIVRIPFTTDHARVARSIASLAANGGTALYDAVTLASTALAREAGQHNLVVFTDGADSSSRTTLADAVARARSAKAPTSVIGLTTPQLDAKVLRALASGTGGTTVTVAASTGLDAAFRAAARDLASQYVVRYGTSEGGSERSIEVTVAVGGVSSSDRIVAFSPRSAAPATSGSGSSAPAGPLVPAFTTPVGLLIGVGAAFAALMLLFGVLATRPKRTQESATLSRALRLYVRGANREKSRQARQEGGSAIARRAANVVERLPKPAGYEERLQGQLDRAGWPFRSAEFLAIQAGAGLAGALVGFAVLGRWWLGVAFAVIGPVLMGAVLARKVASRASAFLAQLPDTLQLLAGSLQAGYGFMQAIDTLVREAQAPTSTEFQRVLAEARLGMPIEDALNTMAERLASEDFKWVVLAINIQRQVGGNLSMLLRTVADTLRERERVRRQIKVLSAEGKLSAWILGVLPFGIAGYIMMVNPTFLGTMTGDPLGRVMIGGALVMLGLGIAWMRKIIRIEV